MKSKQRLEEPQGTMSYQTSFKRSPPFWLLIGARKRLCFSAKSECRTAATFSTCCFYSLERRFLVLEYRKTFSWPILPKQILKNGYFWTKTKGSPLWKNVSFSTFWTRCFYGLERRFFVLDYRKKTFSWPLLLKKVGKIAIFGPKPLEKNQFFHF